MRILVLLFTLLFGGLSYAQDGHDHAGMTHLVFAKGTVHTLVKWTKGPEVTTESTMIVQWMNGVTHTPAEPPGAFDVSLFMPSMGHGSAPTKIQHLIDAQGQPVVGAYEVSNVYFIMGGDWQVNVILKYQDGTSETQTIDINLPEGGGHHHH